MTVRRTLWIGATVVAAAGAAIVIGDAPWRDDTPADIAVAIDWRDPVLVAAGAEVYAQQCATCHGAALEGQADWQTRGPDGLLPAPPHDQTGHTWHHPDAVLFELTKYGPASLAGDDYLSAMPAFEAILTDERIAAVIAFIKSTWPAEIRDRHDQLNAGYRDQN